MKKITLGAVIGAGLVLAGSAGAAKLSSLVDLDWTGLNAKGGEVHKVYDKDTGITCYTMATDKGAGISCLKK